MSQSKYLPAFVDLLSTTTGRDKVCRVIQYATRFLVAQKRQRALYVPVKQDLLVGANRLEALGGSMGMTRKLLRFGRIIDLVRQIKQIIGDITAGKIKDIPKASLKVLSQIYLSLYFLFDHILFFSKIGWINNPSFIKQADYLSNLFWLLQCIFSLIRCFLEARDIKNMQTSSSQKKKNQFKLNIEIARNILDIPIAYGFLEAGSVSNKTMGILGTITSLIGVWQNLKIIN